MVGWEVGLSLIIGLIPLWQREQDKNSSKQKEDFYAFLARHQFDWVRDCISNVHALDSQIEQLLQLNQEELQSRFDLVDEKLMRILYSIDEFRGLTSVLGRKAVLSKQEEDILTYFVASGDDSLHTVITSARTYLQAGNTPMPGIDTRFISANLKNLEKAGYIIAAYNSKGHVYYKLDESALEYARNRQSTNLSVQAQAILKSYFDSKENILTICMDADCVWHSFIPGVDEVLIENEHVLEDVEMLESKKYIQPLPSKENDPYARAYLFTRQGKEYAKSLVVENI